MKQEAFEARYGESWDELSRLIELIGKRSSLPQAERERLAREFPVLYRQICHHLALARARRYSAGLEQRLNQLALDGHQHLYRTRIPFLSALGRFIANDFPVAFRRQWRFNVAAHGLFYLPMLLMALALAFRPELIYSLLEPGDVATMEAMYDPENRRLGRERQSSTDLYMFGVYIYNNISIGFQTFAGGLLFTAGSIFFLVFNGLYIGSIAAHLTAAGFIETFWGFVAGHAAFELTAITIFGASGLKLGYRAIAPGQKRRWHAVRDAAAESLPLVYGGTGMLVLAAFVEAFWSSSTWPPVTLKYGVGIALWILTFAYLLLMGRDESR